MLHSLIGSSSKKVLLYIYIFIALTRANFRWEFGSLTGAPSDTVRHPISTCSQTCNITHILRWTKQESGGWPVGSQFEVVGRKRRCWIRGGVSEDDPAHGKRLLTSLTPFSGI